MENINIDIKTTKINSMKSNSDYTLDLNLSLDKEGLTDLIISLGNSLGTFGEYKIIRIIEALNKGYPSIEEILNEY